MNLLNRNIYELISLMRSFFFNIILPNSQSRAVKIIILLLLISSISFSQEKKRIEILHSGYGESDESLPAGSRRLIDSVYIRHKEILMWCDTAIIYDSNKVDAIGHVHIKKGDTLHLFANNVFYDGNMSFARAWNNVVLINKDVKLYSDTVNYDMENNLSYYDDFGRIEDSTTTLTSVIGRYFMDENNIFFYKEVEGHNEDFTLKSDTVKYNTKTEIMFVEGPTTIRDSANTLYTEDGWYNSKTGESELKRNAIIYNEIQNLKAKYIKYNKENGAGIARGSIRFEDIENKSIILGNSADFNKVEEVTVVTDSAVFITYNSSDSLFLHADTLRTAPDTVEGEKIVTAFYGVRFFRTDLQGLCDSLVYFTKDSIIQLYQKPVIWSENHQISAEKIEMQQNSDAPDELHLTKNSFIISKQDTGQFDQIKGKEMVGYIVDRELTKIDVNGNGQTLYYAREEEDEIIGINRAESSKISIRFKEGKIHQILFIKAPEGELKPLLEITESDKKLKDFDWKIRLRPLTKYDIFPRPEISSDDYIEDVGLKK